MMAINVKKVNTVVLASAVKYAVYSSSIMKEV
jgi:hypothetical protein